jgi:hypothetical protein
MAGLMYDFTAAFIYNNQHDPWSINQREKYRTLPENSLTKTFSRYSRSSHGQPTDSMKEISSTLQSDLLEENWKTRLVGATIKILDSIKDKQNFKVKGRQVQVIKFNDLYFYIKIEDKNTVTEYSIQNNELQVFVSRGSNSKHLSFYSFGRSIIQLDGTEEEDPERIEYRKALGLLRDLLKE